MVVAAISSSASTPKTSTVTFAPLGNKPVEWKRKVNDLPVADRASVERALEALQPRPDVLVVSGSLPAGLDPKRLTRLASRVRRSGVRLALDASGEGLQAGLEAGVWLVKPNLRAAWVPEGSIPSDLRGWR